MHPITIITGSKSSGGAVPPVISSLKELSSTDIFNLSLEFDRLSDTFSKEEDRISNGGVVKAEDEEKHRQVSLTRIRLENIASLLGNIAFKQRVSVELKNYNDEILESIKAIKKAAEKINSIRSTINDFVKVFNFVIDTVQKITTGGFFGFDSILKTVLDGLDVAGVTI